MNQIHARDRRRNRHKMRPDLMILEGRQLLSTFSVNNTSADPTITGSLPWAVGRANADGGAETINFDPAAFAHAPDDHPDRNPARAEHAE